MSSVMKAIVVPRIGTFDYTDRPIPEPEAGEVLIRVSVSGLCRTDLKLIEVGHRDLELPRIPAEEVVGTVCRLGTNTPEQWLQQRVYVYPGTSCGTCPPCISGAENLCRSMRIMGFHRDGGFAEYVTAPVASLTPLPDGLEEEFAVFAEPLSCCLNALELARVSTGDRIGIWGAGPAGTLLARAARSQGAEVTVIEPDQRRCKLASGHPAPAPEMQFDVAIPAVGSPAAYRQALQHLAPRGRLVSFSGLARDESKGILDLIASCILYDSQHNAGTTRPRRAAKRMRKLTSQIPIQY